MSIFKLPDHVVHQIAAGEVIERPASVFKELVENSIDAGATKIRVEMEGGGIDRLSVEDNGRGVAPEDLPLVFHSHATSKLRQIDDLAQISTLGFRGEAMSSIASVAEVEFSTARPGDEHSHRLASRFGQWEGVETEDLRLGTRVEVRRLFEKLPVRHKFLKPSASEARRITQMFREYALAFPSLSWTLCDHDKDRRLEFPKSTAFERALRVFDQEVQYEHWFETQSEKGKWKIHYVGLKPRFFQKSRQRLHLFLNARPIKDRALEFAVSRAFEGYTEYPRYAVGALWIQGSPEHFDVNVHPCKTEVRFLDPDSLFSAIVHGLREALSAIHKNSDDNFKMRAPEAPVSYRSTLSFEPSLPSASKAPLSVASDSAPALIPAREVQTSVVTARLWSDEPGYKYLGQLEKTYLLAKRDEKLFVFDQHALHERILYERWMSQMKASSQLSSQRLLFPQRFDDPRLEVLLEYPTEMKALGFEIHARQPSGVELRAAPAELKESLPVVLEQLVESFQNAVESLLREQIATMACHSAIRAHDRVDESVARQWFEQFQSEDALGHCPHGRPTFIELSPRELEKMFHRS